MDEIKINRNKTTLNIRLYNIVNSRAREMLVLIKDKIEEYGFMHSAPCGVVITGGTSQWKGLKALTSSIFGLPVRLGLPSEVEGPAEVISDPIYSTGVGLLKYANQLEHFAQIEKQDDGIESGGFLDRFRNFISKILKN
jgi:cell division protein FtsA